MTQSFEPAQIVQRLTPAAKEALEELVEAYRLRLLESVNDAAPEGDVSASELLRHTVQGWSVGLDLEQLQYATERAHRARRNQVLLLTSALVSLMLGVLVSMVGLAPLFGWEPRRISGAIAVSVGGAGILAGYATLLIAINNRMRLRRRARELEYRQAVNYRPGRMGQNMDDNDEPEFHKFARTGLFMTGWREVEESLYRLGRDHLGTDPNRRMTLSSIVLALTKSGVLAESAAQEARWAVDLRNRLVHGDGTHTVSERDLERLARLTDALAANSEHTN